MRAGHRGALAANRAPIEQPQMIAHGTPYAVRKPRKSCRAFLVDFQPCTASFSSPLLSLLGSPHLAFEAEPTAVAARAGQGARRREPCRELPRRLERIPLAGEARLGARAASAPRIQLRVRPVVVVVRHQDRLMSEISVLPRKPARLNSRHQCCAPPTRRRCKPRIAARRCHLPNPMERSWIGIDHSRYRSSEKYRSSEDNEGIDMPS